MDEHVLQYSGLSLIPVDLVSHDVVEIVSSHVAVVVQISSHDHALDLLSSQVLSEVLGDLGELRSVNLSLNSK